MAGFATAFLASEACLRRSVLVPRCECGASSSDKNRR